MKGVEKFYRSGVIVFEIDQARATYKEIPYKALGQFGKRKFENLVYVEGANERMPIKFTYVETPE